METDVLSGGSHRLAATKANGLQPVLLVAVAGDEGNTAAARMARCQVGASPGNHNTEFNKMNGNG